MRFGDLAGEVVHVGADALVSEDGIPFYKVRIRTEGNAFTQGGLRYQLYPGVQVIASITTGHRTVLRYLLDPFLDTFGKAMRER